MSATERGSLLVAGVLIAASAAGLRAVQPRLAERVAAVKEQDESYSLPPPDQLPALSLGYRSALADLLWARVLVTQGMRISEHRRFDNGALYFRSIFALEPTFREPYLMLDAILTFGAVRASIEDVKDTRALFELGMRERPNDAQLFLTAGGFLAYIAPGYLPEEDRTEWRLLGGRILARAAELATGQEGLQWHALAAAGVLNRNGERDAAVSFLERTYEITEDPEIREEILKQLRAMRADEAAERARGSARRFEETWRGEFPFVSRALILLLGPRADPAACAGPGRAEQPACARDWRSWAERASAPR